MLRSLLNDIENNNLKDLGLTKDNPVDEDNIIQQEELDPQELERLVKLGVEKTAILNEIKKLKEKGFEPSQNYTTDFNIEDIKTEYERLKKQQEESIDKEDKLKNIQNTPNNFNKNIITYEKTKKHPDNITNPDNFDSVYEQILDKIKILKPEYDKDGTYVDKPTTDEQKIEYKIRCFDYYYKLYDKNNDKLKGELKEKLKTKLYNYFFDNILQKIVESSEQIKKTITEQINKDKKTSRIKKNILDKTKSSLNYEIEQFEKLKTKSSSQKNNFEFNQKLINDTFKDAIESLDKFFVLKNVNLTLSDEVNKMLVLDKKINSNIINQKKRVYNEEENKYQNSLTQIEQLKEFFEDKKDDITKQINSFITDFNDIVKNKNNSKMLEKLDKLNEKFNFNFIENIKNEDKINKNVLEKIHDKFKVIKHIKCYLDMLNKILTINTFQNGFDTTTFMSVLTGNVDIDESIFSNCSKSQNISTMQEDELKYYVTNTAFKECKNLAKNIPQSIDNVIRKLEQINKDTRQKLLEEINNNMFNISLNEQLKKFNPIESSVKICLKKLKELFQLITNTKEDIFNKNYEEKKDELKILKKKINKINDKLKNFKDTLDDELYYLNNLPKEKNSITTRIKNIQSIIDKIEKISQMILDDVNTEINDIIQLLNLKVNNVTNTPTLSVNSSEINKLNLNYKKQLEEFKKLNIFIEECEKLINELSNINLNQPLEDTMNLYTDFFNGLSLEEMRHYLGNENNKINKIVLKLTNEVIKEVNIRNDKLEKQDKLILKKIDKYNQTTLLKQFFELKDHTFGYYILIPIDDIPNQIKELLQEFRKHTPSENHVGGRIKKNKTNKSNKKIISKKNKKIIKKK